MVSSAIWKRFTRKATRFREDGVSGNNQYGSFRVLVQNRRIRCATDERRNDKGPESGWESGPFSWVQDWVHLKAKKLVGYLRKRHQTNEIWNLT
jgi:hypothetical protein